MSANDPSNPRNNYAPPPTGKKRGEWICVNCKDLAHKPPYDITLMTTLPLAQLDAHVNRWAARTATYTAGSLARYITKHSEYYAITQSQYVTQLSKLPTNTTNDEQK